MAARWKTVRGGGQPPRPGRKSRTGQARIGIRGEAAQPPEREPTTSSRILLCRRVNVKIGPIAATRESDNRRDSFRQAGSIQASGVNPASGASNGPGNSTGPGNWRYREQPPAAPCPKQRVRNNGAVNLALRPAVGCSSRCHLLRLEARCGNAEDSCGWSGAVAQLGERCPRMAEVEGSSPFGSTRTL